MSRSRVVYLRLAAASTIVFALSYGIGVQPVVAQYPAASSPEDSVRGMELARGEALLSADTVALSRMVAAEFVEISRLGQLRSRTDNMREIATGQLILSSVKYDSMVVRLYGDVAVLTGIADNEGTYRGFPFRGKIRYMRVFVRRDGRWQAVAMQQTPVP